CAGIETSLCVAVPCRACVALLCAQASRHGRSGERKVLESDGIPWPSGGGVGGLDMEALGGDQTLAVDAVPREIIDVDRVVDAQAQLGDRLGVGSEIHQQDLIGARRALRDWRRSAEEAVAEFRSSRLLQHAVDEAVQLGGRPENLVEAREIVVLAK